MNVQQDPSQALRSFLQQCGLEQYLDAMLAEDLTLETLRDLGDADLRELGLSMGHRKALHAALEKAGDAQAEPQDTSTQRRQLTIFFCDLVGSTELAGRYDAEDMADILDRYHRHVAGLVSNWGGMSLGTQGDGIIVCFGYPQATENDVERAVGVALAISREVPKLVFEDGLVLHTRIGIATGRVLVRPPVRDSSALVGDTLNLAARLQDVAKTDTVVLGGNTEQLIRQSADLTHLETRQLKGFEQPVPIFEVHGLKDRAEQGITADLASSMLGRDTEIQRIRDLWDDAKTGTGRALILSGDAGIGKSQLLEVARQAARTDKASILRYFSAPGYENSALYPLRAHIARNAGLQNPQDGDDIAGKLAAFAEEDDPLILRLLADLLSLDPGEAIAPTNMTATEQKQATFAMLQKQFDRQLEQGPLMVLAEDVHWADPTTLEFLAHLLSHSVAQNAVFLIITHRPAPNLSWDALDHCERMALDRLDEKQSRAVVERVFGTKTCPPEIQRKIIDASDGVPLYLEELSRSVLAQNAGNSGGFNAVSVPITLEDSLMARLDRLSQGKSLVQTGAVFGRRFATPALREVMSLDEQRFETALREPIEAEILMPEATGSNTQMLFRHALLQQAAYEGLARRKRRELHAKIADMLLQEQPRLAESEPETLAWHFAGAAEYGQAITYLIEAGKKAAARAAQVEASNHFFAALDHLEHLPQDRARDELEVLLRALLGSSLMATRGFAAPEVHDAFARARELCVSLGDNPMYCSCLYGLLTVAASRSNKAEALELAQEMHTTFAQAPVPSWAIAAEFACGFVRFFEGDFDAAEACFDRAIEIYTPDQHALLVEQFGDNLTEFSICYKSWICMIRGELDDAAALLARSEDMANELSNKNAQTRSLSFRMGRMLELGMVEDAARTAPQVIEISTVQGYPYWACAGQIGLGWAMAAGQNPDGIEPIKGSLGFFDAIGQRNPQTYWRTYLIEAYTNLGQRDAALNAADVALEMSRTGLDSAFEPTILLRKGEAYLLEPADPKAAEACFRDALKLAQKSGAHLYSFLNALALAELLLAENRAPEEAGTLRAAFAKIESTVEIPALIRARDVLERL